MTVPERPARVALNVQVPGSGIVQNTPHSSPGRRQLLPVCSSGALSSRIVCPSGPVAVTVSAPVPVIFHIVLSGSPWRR